MIRKGTLEDSKNFTSFDRETPNKEQRSIFGIPIMNMMRQKSITTETRQLFPSPIAPYNSQSSYKSIIQSVVTQNKTDYTTMLGDLDFE